ADPRRRAQGDGRAVAAARVPVLTAAGTAHGAVREQDGPRRLLAGGLREDRRRVLLLRDEAGRAGPDGHPDLRAARGQHRDPVGEDAVVRRAVTVAPPGT